MSTYTFLENKIQPIYVVAEEDRIVSIGFSKKDVEGIKEEETPFLTQVKNELLEYLEGRRKEFDLKLRMIGTPFQLKVWQALQTIPYGKVATYKEVAEMVGCPQGARAVGMACNRNNIPIIIPCHRVVGSGNKLVGYAGGIVIKERLLRHEGYVSSN